MEFVALSTILARGEKSISPRALYELQQPLVEALIEWRDNGSAGQRLTEQSIEISNDGKHIKILDASGDEAQNITDYGDIFAACSVKLYWHRNIKHVIFLLRSSLGQV